MRTRFAIVLLLGLLLVTHGAPAWAQSERTIVLNCGILLAVPGTAPLHDVSVVVRGGRIVDVRPGLVDREKVSGRDVQIIDLEDYFVLPGMIDSHTHITAEYTADVRLRRVQESDADAALRGAEFARRTLEAGFTTIRNVGSSGDAAFALRDAIAAGRVPGPRILVAGEALTPTGGHSDATLGYREDLFPVADAMKGIADGIPGARRAVRAQVKRGADVIKLTATGGVLSQSDLGTEQQLFDDEIQAIVDTAHLLDKKVAAHAHGTGGINASLRAGVDSIEHGTFLDDTSIELFVQTGAFLVPTILAGKTVEEHARQPGYFPPSVAEKALQVGPKIQEAFARAIAGGVRIAFGTDSGVSKHGENAREFGYMVEAGMSEMEVIVSATRNAAELLGLQGEVGTVEAGKAADLIATRRNPLIDITELSRVVFVMHDGETHRALPETP